MDNKNTRIGFYVDSHSTNLRMHKKYDKIAPAVSFFFIDQNFRIKHQSLHKIVLGNFIHSLQHTGSIPARWTESIDSVFSVL